MTASQRCSQKKEKSGNEVVVVGELKQISNLGAVGGRLAPALVPYPLFPLQCAVPVVAAPPQLQVHSILV